MISIAKHVALPPAVQLPLKHRSLIDEKEHPYLFLGNGALLTLQTFIS